MTTILRIERPHRQKGLNHPLNVLPHQVVEWLEENKDMAEMPEPNYHHGYFVFAFYDDYLATEFKLRFHHLFDKPK